MNVGDRVSHGTYGEGNVILVFQDSYELPILVQFDNEHRDLHDGQGKGKENHCYFCAEKDLMLISTKEAVGFKIGDRVSHKTYGDGKIINITDEWPFPFLVEFKLEHDDLHDGIGIGVIVGKKNHCYWCSKEELIAREPKNKFFSFKKLQDKLSKQILELGLEHELITNGLEAEYLNKDHFAQKCYIAGIVGNLAIRNSTHPTSWWLSLGDMFSTCGDVPFMFGVRLVK